MAKRWARKGQQVAAWNGAVLGATQGVGADDRFLTDSVTKVSLRLTPSILPTVFSRKL